MSSTLSLNTLILAQHLTRSLSPRSLSPNSPHSLTRSLSPNTLAPSRPTLLHSRPSTLNQTISHSQSDLLHLGLVRLHLASSSLLSDLLRFQDQLSNLQGTGVVLCVEKALAQSGVSWEDVNYINSHATSTQAGDIKEYQALICCFGQNPELKVNSTKSMIGHLLGVAWSLSKRSNITIGLECAGGSKKRKDGHKGFRIDVHELKPDFN
ncbi:hypothetical protein Syun_001394 [Stephania yunnanensis]|uniref:beta-ketoacyl-[acyl-carrier-protein] synthase I n=1 Tax=Stephania yunnanensis TaxID=152371 RepID=A0AAP0Q7Q4_9MAGN